MKRDYETTIVFDANLDDAKIDTEIEKITSLVTTHGGSIKNIQNTGRKKLAYRIKQHDFGVYILIAHDGENTLVSAMERALSINENIIRHLVVKRDKLAPEGELVVADDFVQVFGEDESVSIDGNPDVVDDVVGAI